MSQKERGGSRRPTLFVTGFAGTIRAKDLAVHFEKFGEIIRCDVPAPPVGRTSRFAFIEYVHEGDADKALETLNGFEFDGGKLIVEWAKRSPGSRWRPNGAPPPPRSSHDRDRGGDRERDRDRPRDSYERDYRDRDRDRDRRERDRSRSPRRDHRDREGAGRHRSRSHDRRSGRDPRDDMAPMRERDRDRRGPASPPPRRGGRDHENGRDDRY